MNLIENRLYVYSQKQIKRYVYLLAFLALVSLLELGFFPVSGLAQQGLKFGGIEIHPGVAFEAKYNSNVFLSPEKISDTIFTIAPSLIFEHKRQKGDNFGFFLKYLGEQELFVRLKEQDFYNQDVSAHLQFGDTGRDMNLDLRGQYTHARLALSPEFASAVFNPRQVRTTYDLNSNLLWRFTRDIEANIGVQFSRNLFKDDTMNNYHQYDGNGTLDWQTTTLTSIGVNYSYQHRDYLEANNINLDGTLHSASFIVKWNPLSVLSSEFWIGLIYLKVIDDESQDRDDITYKAQLKYQPKITSSWTLVSFREIPFAFWNNNVAYQRDAVELTWNQKLGVKLQGLSRISFETRKYDIAALDGGAFKLRKDEYFYGLLSLTYSIQDWWNVILEYSYTNNNSNFNLESYSGNLTFLRFSFIL